MATKQIYSDTLENFDAVQILVFILERILALGLLGFFIFPVAWVGLTAIKTRVDAFAFPPVWFFDPTFDAFTQLLFQRGFMTNVLSSVIVASANTILVILISLPAAYSMAQYDTGGENALMYLLSMRFMPPIVIIPPLFIEMNVLGLVGTRLSLIILYSIINIPFAVWLLRAAFQQIPQSYIDASRLDGASEVEILYYIGIPMIKPAIITAVVISFIFAWNEFLFALIFTSGATTTAPVKISTLISGREIFWNQIMAGTAILIVPVLLLTFFSQRYIIQGMTFGAVE